jgi:hypothetical protein
VQPSTPFGLPSTMAFGPDPAQGWFILYLFPFLLNFRLNNVVVSKNHRKLYKPRKNTK